MISFSQYTEMHFLRSQDKLKVKQIAQKMSLDSKTVAKWLACERYEARRNKGRSSKLDPHKAKIRSWLEKHPYSAQQIFQRLSEGGDYHGGYTIVKEYVRTVRPRPPKAYLSLSFAPGESAQVDWGHCGTVAVGFRASPPERIRYGAQLLASDVYRVHPFTTAGALSGLSSRVCS